MARRLNASDPGFAAAFDALLNTRHEEEEGVAQAVRAIIAQVRARGDAALVELTNKFDRAGVAVDTLKLSTAEIDAAVAQVSKEQAAAIETAAARIEAYHRRQLPQDARYTDETGALLGWRWTSVDSVGLYVPGGTAAYPSSVLMNAIPARVAGVRRVVMATPASGGAVNPLVLAAARRAGVSDIYRIGGAQAVAALAYGTASIRAVDKIVGPGNAYVAAAKREVFGQVGIDSVAGPSEILVVADADNDPEWIAADLLSQAEHDASSQSILITDDAAFADKVDEAAVRQLAILPRSAIAAKSWGNHGAIITVKKLEDAAPLADAFAPEHLEIATADPEGFATLVRHAGAIFLGRYTPEAMGDYIAGPNHVLPTSRTARFSSGLSVLDFMKRTTLLGLDAKAIAAIGPDALILADSEGLQAHARSIAARLNRARPDRKG
ncbi:MAG TPA: histidinol dehydrogenase [Rhizomicrobium sp.]|jgi:histidinol dehydrogenase|nr:histidinol dehydrogenase [Rhizomicrobium sp.]